MRLRPPPTPFAKCWFWPLFLLQGELASLSSFGETTESFLEDELTKLRREKEGELEPHGRCATWDQWFERLDQFEPASADESWDQWMFKVLFLAEEYSPILRSSLIVSLVATVEAALHHICEELRAATGHPRGIRDVKGTLLYRVSTYLREVANLRVPTASPTFRAAGRIITLRNQLAHRGLHGLDDMERRRVNVPGVKFVPGRRFPTFRATPLQYLVVIDSTCLESAIQVFQKFADELEVSFSQVEGKNHH